MAECGGQVPGQRALCIELMDTEETANLALVAHALSDPIRVQMVHMLERQSDLCTCEVMQLLGLAQSKASYHLRVLLDAGLVTRTTAGTWSYYTLRHPDVLECLRALAELGAGVHNT